MPTSTINTATRNAMVVAANGLVNTGAGANATYEYGTASFSSVLITWNLDATAPWASPSSGTAALTGTPLALASATGTAAEYRIRDKNGNVIRSGVLDATVSITSGLGYTLAAPVTQPAS